jgi:hypothetical protein
VKLFRARCQGIVRMKEVFEARAQTKRKKTNNATSVV